MKRVSLTCISTLLCGLLTFNAAPSQTLKIVHFDVGKGDATLFISPSGSTLLVDAGSETSGGDSAAATINEYLTTNGIDALTYSLATHFHDDHINGLRPLFEEYGYTPSVAYDRGSPGIDPYWYNCACFNSYIRFVEDAAIRDSIFAGDTIDLGEGVTLQVIYANSDFIHGRHDPLPVRHQAENIRSICLLLQYGSFRYVVAGDLTGTGGFSGDKETPSAGLIGDIDVFQVNHHGGGSSTNQNWLDVLKPEAAIVSTNMGMVNQVVVDRIDSCATMVALYHTEESTAQGVKSHIVNGNVILETDGIEFYSIAGDTFLLAPEPPVSVAANPSVQYVVIPPEGGSVAYELQLINQSGGFVEFDYWTLWHHEGTWRSGLDAQRLQMNAGGSRSFDLETNLAAASNPGNYVYEARVGIYPDSAWDSYCFPVWKDTLDGGFPEDGDSVQVPLPFAPSQVRAAKPEIRLSPNPLNPSTRINYTLPQDSHVLLTVYDISGKKIVDLVDGWQNAGSHEIEFVGTHLASGIYLYLLKTNGFQVTGKMVLIK